MTLFQLFLVLHISTGMVAVLVGFAPLLTAKGSRAHRLWGRAFVALMTTLSFIIEQLPRVRGQDHG